MPVVLLLLGHLDDAICEPGVDLLVRIKVRCLRERPGMHRQPILNANQRREFFLLGTTVVMAVILHY